MTRMTRRWIAPFLAALAVVAVQPPSARAILMLDVTDDLGNTVNIMDGGPLDSDGVVNGTINVVTDAAAGGLNAIFANFNFGGLSATESSLTASGNDVAFVRQTGDVARTDLDALTHSLTITASEDTFSHPIGPIKTMVTSASDTFGNTVTGMSRTFQSLFNNSISSPLLAFVPPAGELTYSSSNPGVTTPLGVQPTPFALSNTTQIVFTASGGSGAASDQFTGKTAVTGTVPEPSSVVLGLISLPALLALGRRMRRRVGV